MKKFFKFIGMLVAGFLVMFGFLLFLNLGLTSINQPDSVQVFVGFFILTLLSGVVGYIVNVFYDKFNGGDYEVSK